MGQDRWWKWSLGHTIQPNSSETPEDSSKEGQTLVLKEERAWQGKVHLFTKYAQNMVSAGAEGCFRVFLLVCISYFTGLL
jgi:hypothetical protein